MERSEKAALSQARIEVRHCRTLAEYEECLRLEQITWGTGILVPTAIFVVAQETGGQILGAFAGEEMVGFTLALVGERAGRPFLHSHMTAVLDAFRDRGVGRSLKLFQRQDGMDRGFPLVEWTFDPLELRNAHFNFMRLGAIVRRLIPNCYGITDSPLHAGLPTDRFVAEWWLDSPRVNRLLAAGADPRAAAANMSSANAVRISLPSDIVELRIRDRAAAGRVQTEVREQFEECFGKGYVVTGITAQGATAEYHLQPVAEIASDIFPASGRE